MVYYAFLALFYLFSIFAFEVIPAFFSSLLLFASLCAFIFSLYLLALQIFVLKKGCSWCIISALTSILIFILTALIFDFGPMMQIFTK